MGTSMKTSEKQRKAACLVWGLLLLEKGAPEVNVLMFKENLNTFLLQHENTEIDSLSFGYEGRVRLNLLKRAAEDAGIAEKFFPDPALSMTFDEPDHVISHHAHHSGEQRKFHVDTILAEQAQHDREKMTNTAVKGSIDSVQAQTKNSSLEPPNNQATGRTRQKVSSGLLVSDLEPGSDDYNRYLAYEWYVQGRAKARRLVTYSRLAKWWGSRLNLLALIPGVGFLTSQLYLLYRLHKAREKIPSGKEIIVGIVLSCIPILNLAVNHLACLQIRTGFKNEIDQFLNTHSTALKSKDLDVDFEYRGVKTRIPKPKVLNDDLAPLNNKVILRRLTENEFLAYSHRSTVREAESPEKKSEVKYKKLVEKVTDNTGTHYHILLDQAQNKRFEERLQKLQPGTALFSSVDMAKSKGESVILKDQVISMHAARK